MHRIAIGKFYLSILNVRISGILVKYLPLLHVAYMHVHWSIWKGKIIWFSVPPIEVTSICAGCSCESYWLPLWCITNILKTAHCRNTKLLIVHTGRRNDHMNFNIYRHYEKITFMEHCILIIYMQSESYENTQP